MRVPCKGYYVQYKDSGHPVEVLDRVPYAFQSEDRTVLVSNPDHLALLLTTGRYRIVGAEIDGAETLANVVPERDLTMTTTYTKPVPKRGRPRKER